ncbi:MAG: nitroreductase family protein [Gemmatimonadota bacterium]
MSDGGATGPAKPRFLPLTTWRGYPEDEMIERATTFRAEIARRRTVRQFSDRPVPRAVIEECLRTAGTAPSGANLQPWHFVVVSDAGTKRTIRERAEVEEREFYRHRASNEWIEALAPLGTDEHKPFLETAPVLIAVFAEKYGSRPDGSRFATYYATESVGLATGLLIAAVHHAGLVSLTHTPSPMGFLNEILGRPRNEKPFLILVVGYPAEDAVVPDIGRKPLEEIATFL